MSSNIRIKKICQFCEQEFVTKTTVTKYCGDNCAKRAYKQRKKEEKIAQVKDVQIQKIELESAKIQDKEILSIKEVCAFLGASRSTIYRQMKSGVIKYTKLGDRVLIRKVDIDKLFV